MTKMEGAWPQILGTGVKFKRVPCQKSCCVNQSCCIYKQVLLYLIFNTSFLTGIVPGKFKLARVIPVFKKGSQTKLNNCRLISLLLIFNEFLEKLMFNWLVDFLDKRHLIYNKQFEFRTHHSTDGAVLNIIH